MFTKDSRGSSELMSLILPRKGRPGGEGISTVPSIFALVDSPMVADAGRGAECVPLSRWQKEWGLRGKGM